MKNDEIQNGIISSLLDSKVNGGSKYKHKLLTNEKKQKVITTIIRELKECQEFKISVAFITYSGVNLLLEILKSLEKKGVKGQIITSDYLYFSEPKALKKLASFSNIDLKMIRGEHFHAKGYFFKHDQYWTVILGSSNLTSSALTINKEWNIQLSAMENGTFTSEIITEVDKLCSASSEFSEFIDEYTEKYNNVSADNKLKNQLFNDYQNSNFNEKMKTIEPNQMQKAALNSLKLLRQQKQNKGLIISATGTGKTILSGLDVKEVNPQKCLFIVHRENIAKRSLKTYQEIMPEKSFGLLTGNEKSFTSDYLFATIQSLKNHLDQFTKNEFTYIIIDEVHHGGAATYQEVLNYFNPQFLLGMTATPNRTDGFSIFQMFDYNIAYEYPLSMALENQLLAPFHYFGIKDITVNNQIVTEAVTINDLIHPQRIKHIIDNLKYYGYSGNRVAGLIFVSNVEEAQILSKSLNNYGMKTCALTGSDSEINRLNAINDLEDGKLDYIITVDIFNEGIDIPCVNQIVLLRATTSVIVYIQQLGRGLRKYKDKEFVVIIDFIGNYKQNYLIPLAFSGSNSLSKDELKKEIIMEGTDYLIGKSVIQFSEIVQKEIMQQISQTNLGTLSMIKQDYNYLKQKYNRQPKLTDFAANNLLNPAIILEKYGYYQIVEKFEKINYNFNQEEISFIEFFRKSLLPFKRPHEMEILNHLIIQESCLISKINTKIEIKYQIKQQLQITTNAIKHLERTIFTSYSPEKKFDALIIQVENKIELSSSFKTALTNKKFKREIIEMLKFGINDYQHNNYQHNQKLTIGKMYTKREAFKYALHDYSNGYQVAGYTFMQNEVMIFITLDNSKVLTVYDNQFLNHQTITWFSKENRRLKYADGSLTKEGRILNNEYTLQLFVKKNSGENFYYLGTINQVLRTEMTKSIKGKPVIKYTLELKVPVEEKLYSYLKFNENSNNQV